MARERFSPQVIRATNSISSKIPLQPKTLLFPVFSTTLQEVEWPILPPYPLPFLPFTAGYPSLLYCHEPVESRNSTNRGREAKEMSLTIQTIKNENAVILGLRGRVDETTVGQLRRACTSWILEGEKTIVLDFDAAPVVSSVGIHAIFVAGRQLEQAGGSLVLCGFHGQVERSFQFSGLTTVFQTFESIEEWSATPTAPAVTWVYTGEMTKPWGWTTVNSPVSEHGVQSEVKQPLCTPAQNPLPSVMPNRLPKIASEDNSIGSWLVRAFLHPVACLDFCASWWRRHLSMELTPSKR
jgi:anti-anti-sigma factor